MITVLLADSDMRHAHVTAVRAVEERHQFRHHGPTMTRTQNIGWHEQGMMGELAVARWHGVVAPTWDTYDRRACDVADLQVKTTSPKRNLVVNPGELDIHPGSRRYLLCWATVNDPVVQLIGWATLQEICVDLYWRPEHDFYLMPYTDLSPMVRF